MNYNYFIGIDVSKHTIDAAAICKDDQSTVLHNTFENSSKGIDEMIIFFTKAYPKFDIHKTLFCMEATGVYCSALLDFSKNRDLHFG